MTHELISLGTWATSNDRTQQQLWFYQKRPDFPAPVMTIPESGRVKRLWKREDLDRYFSRLEAKRQAEYVARQQRATTKRANAELYKYCRFLGGPDAALCRQQILTEYADDPVLACESMGIEFIESQ